MSVNEVLSLLKRKAPVIIVTVTIFIIAGALFSAFIATPKYQAKLRLIVRANNEEQQSGVQTSYYGNLLDQQRIKTYCSIIGNSVVMQKIAETVDNGMDKGQITKLISINTIPDTVIIEVLVKTESATLSAAIANLIPDLSRSELERIMKVDSVEAIETAEVPLEPIEPNMNRNIILAALLGIMLSVGGLILREITDQTIKTDIDVRMKLGMNVIAMIPDSQKDKKKKKNDIESGPVITNRRAYSKDPGYQEKTGGIRP